MPSKFADFVVNTFCMKLFCPETEHWYTVGIDVLENKNDTAKIPNSI